MQRLCGCPGCSDAASVAYGMHAEDLVFWLDVLPERPQDGAAVLCQRHADSMVVPRGWTLDDLRDPDLHLFRPPQPTPTHRTAGRRPARERPVGEQLQLGADLDSAPVIEAQPETTTNVDPGQWTPSFDEADDLDGLLLARSPLLSRAFRTSGSVDE